MWVPHVSETQRQQEDRQTGCLTSNCYEGRRLTATETKQQQEDRQTGCVTTCYKEHLTASETQQQQEDRQTDSATTCYKERRLTASERTARRQTD